jgi:hypothetical protein
MKKIILLTGIAFCFLTSFGQPIVNRSGRANTVQDARLMAQFNFFTPRYIDTTAANLNKGIDSAGAIIFCYNTNSLWQRTSNPKAWVQVGANSTAITNITTINDSTIVICNGQGVCDTIIVDNITISNSYLINDSTLVVCDSLQVCDTLHVPPQNLFLFQNGVRTVTPGIVEFGDNSNIGGGIAGAGQLLHNTTLDTRYNQLVIQSAMIYNYGFEVNKYPNFGFENGTGLQGWLHENSASAPNQIRLGINYTDSVYVAEDNLIGYMGSGKVGYMLNTNATGAGSFGMGVDDVNAKFDGIFFHTKDTFNNDAITFFGGRPPLEQYVAKIATGGSFADNRIMTLLDNKNIRLYGYDSATRNDGSLTKVLGTDANGNVVLGTVAGTSGSVPTFQQTLNAGNSLANNDSILLNNHVLNFKGNGGFHITGTDDIIFRSGSTYNSTFRYLADGWHIIPDYVSGNGTSFVVGVTSQDTIPYMGVDVSLARVDVAITGGLNNSIDGKGVHIIGYKDSPFVESTGDFNFKDAITFQDSIKAPNIITASNTINKKVVLWNSVTKDFEIISKDSVGSGGGGSGNPNSNIGSGYRWAVPFTNNIKTVFAGTAMRIDSSSNSNALTFKVDTSWSNGVTTLKTLAKVRDSLAALIGGVYNFPVLEPMVAIDGGSNPDTLTIGLLRTFGSVGQAMRVASGGTTLEWYTPTTYSGTNFILNQTSQQSSSNFNISGNGVIGGTLSIGTATFTSASHELTISDVNGGAVFNVQNTNASGYSGIQYLKNTGAIGVFTGLYNPTNEFRFNNILTSGYIDFQINSVPAFTINNDLSVDLNAYTGAANSLVYLTSAGKFQRTTINPINVGLYLTSNTTAVGNVGGGEDNLMTYSLPASTLATNGSYAEFEMNFQFATNANSKELKIYFGTDVIYDYSGISLAGGGMTVRGKIYRTGSATQLIAFDIVSTNNPTISSTSVTTQTLSGAVTLKATMTATTTDDGVQKALSVKYFGL